MLTDWMDFAAQLNQLPDGEPAPEERLRQALAMYDEGVALQRETLRRKHPGAAEADLDKHLDRWLSREDER